MIGILAGMGPKSTGPFVDKIVDECQKIYGATNDIDFPHMMIYSCPTPFYIDKPINHTDMEMAIITLSIHQTVSPKPLYINIYH